ncbi:MAG: hypothetical protein AAF182_03275 [Pseudomonadota bacterium]
MKNSLKTLALVGVVFGLSACDTLSGVNERPYDAPYSLERTAKAEAKAAPVVEPAPEPVIEPAPATPVVQQCDYSAWESRVAALEADLASCRESSSRVRDAYRDELTK